MIDNTAATVELFGLSVVFQKHLFHLCATFAVYFFKFIPLESKAPNTSPEHKLTWISFHAIYLFLNFWVEDFFEQDLVFGSDFEIKFSYQIWIWKISISLSLQKTQGKCTRLTAMIMVSKYYDNRSNVLQRRADCEIFQSDSSRDPKKLNLFESWFRNFLKSIQSSLDALMENYVSY